MVVVMSDQPTPESPERAPLSAYPRPTLEVIPLDCEITAYAPDGDDPLF
jgi:hypothetical protein